MSLPARASQALQGRRIVITRPAGQGETLARLIEAQGGRPILFPVIAIVDAFDRSRLDAAVDSLEGFHAAIFISPNAAAKGMQAIRARREVPPQLAMIAIGGGTARALREYGVSSVVVPKSRFDSEALLDLPELKEVARKRIVIFRGEGGRALLGDTLTARGAIVEYAECYRRTRPDADVPGLLATWSLEPIEGVVATSSEGLRNFHELLGDAGRSRLAGTTLFVPHPRIGATAAELGLSSIVVTAPGDEGIAAGIVGHFKAAA